MYISSIESFPDQGGKSSHTHWILLAGAVVWWRRLQILLVFEMCYVVYHTQIVGWGEGEMVAFVK